MIRGKEPIHTLRTARALEGLFRDVVVRTIAEITAGIDVPRSRRDGRRGVESLLNGMHRVTQRAEVKVVAVKLDFTVENCVDWRGSSGKQQRKRASTFCRSVLHGAQWVGQEGGGVCSRLGYSRSESEKERGRK